MALQVQTLVQFGQVLMMHNSNVFYPVGELFVFIAIFFRHLGVAGLGGILKDDIELRGKNKNHE